MQKPHKDLLKLDDIGIITSIEVKDVQTGTETSDTYVTLSSSFTKKSMTFKKQNYSVDCLAYLDIEVGYNYVAKIAPIHKDKIRKWKEFVKQNETEYETYLELKAKFEK